MKKPDRVADNKIQRHGDRRRDHGLHPNTCKPSNLSPHNGLIRHPVGIPEISRLLFVIRQTHRAPPEVIETNSSSSRLVLVRIEITETSCADNAANTSFND
jgi:hypothetical protein